LGPGENALDAPVWLTIEVDSRAECFSWALDETRRLSDLVVGGRRGRVYDQKHGPNFEGEPTWGMIVIVKLATKCLQFDIISPTHDEWAKHEAEVKLLLSTVTFHTP
jgi:hypothetical protein